MSKKERSRINWKFVKNCVLIGLGIGLVIVVAENVTPYASEIAAILVLAAKVAGAGIGVFLLGLGALKAHDVYDYLHHKLQDRRSHKAQRQALEIANERARTQIQLARDAMEKGRDFKDGSLSIAGPRIELPRYQEYAIPQPETLPEPYTFSSVLDDGFDPARDGILLGCGQELITVQPGESMCHTTFTGPTDAGKTNDCRVIIPQLLYQEKVLYLADKSWQPFRRDRKLGVVYDYTPIAKLLAHAPITTTKELVGLLKYLYREKVNRADELAKVRTANALVDFEDWYIAVDELPAFAADDKQVMEYIGKLLREARQYGIFFIGSAQDLLTATLKTDNGAIRRNLLTNFYAGGDPTTAKIVLDLKKAPDETGLGVKGVKYLRAKGAGVNCEKIRTPLADDEATHMLLDDMAARSPYQANMDYPTPKERPATPEIPQEEAAPANEIDEDKLELVVKAWHEGHHTYHALAAAANLSEWDIRKLRPVAEQRGLIEKKGRKS